MKAKQGMKDNTDVSLLIASFWSGNDSGAKI